MEVVRIRAALYLRISRDKEGQSLGVARQEDDARALAQRRGWSVVQVFADNDMTASGRKRRPGWEALLEAIEAGQIEAVVAYSSSRLYRNLRDLTRLIDLADAGRVQIATVASGDVTLDTADGRMTARILASVDQREWEATSERRRSQVKQSRALGGWNGGRRPFGFRGVKNGDGVARLEVVVDEAALIRDAAGKVLSGVALSTVTADWNARGIRTTGGKLWRPSHLAQVLRNPLYVPAVLMPSDVERLEGLFNRRKLGRAPERYLLTGLVRCGICGSSMRGTGGRYVCTRGSDVHPEGATWTDRDGEVHDLSGKPIGSHLSIRAHLLDALVTAAAADRPDPEVVAVHDPSEPLVQRREQIVREMENLGETEPNPHVRRGVARRLQRDLDEIDSQIKASTPSTYGFRTLLEDVENWNDRAWLESLVNHVIVHPAPRNAEGHIIGRSGFDPSRVEIMWR